MPLLGLVYLCYITPTLAIHEPNLDHVPPISLDFQEIEVRKALQTLAQFTQQNLIIDGSIEGKISLHLSQVRPEEALEAILRLQGLVQEKTGTTYIIRPKNTISQTISAPELVTKHISLQHRDAKEVAALLLENPTYKNANTEIKLDPSNNSLWIRDTPRRIQELEKWIRSFDKIFQQVLIEARIVSMNRNFERTLGTRFGLKPCSNPTSTMEPEAIPPPQEPETTTQYTSLPPLTVDLPLNRYALGISTPFVWKGINRLLDLELSAMENEGNGHVISSPHLITTDRTPAFIEAGSEIPYQEKGRHGNTNIAFKKAVLSLKVTPTATPSGHILLKLELHHDKPGAPDLQNIPAIDTQTLNTQVLLKPGETIMLGGIYETVTQQSIYRIPILGQIPVLGWLFKQRVQNETKRELLIFVTPNLVTDVVLKRLQTIPS
jgi:type IV pilus assembly protein PilQ